MKFARTIPALWIIATPAVWSQNAAPDIRSVQADLTIPPVTDHEPAPGKRVKQKLPSRRAENAYHVLYLPTNYDRHRKKKYPVIIELAGNGGFRSKQGDVSTGRPEGSKLGYGMSAGRDFIWVCLPYVNSDGTDIAIRWWGDRPTYEVEPTVEYCKQAVRWICDKYNGDSQHVVLCGFSRGAIACNYVGLHDDEIARLWCGFVAYSHYDGVRKWPYPYSDRESARKRLMRLGNRPQFICQEGSSIASGLPATEKMLQEVKPDGRFTFTCTGFRNHADAWVLRPSTARAKLRTWLRRVAEN